ncbi:MAG: hypothetical protein O3C05_00075 [Proteobacteria bacterium]|nr:hypothetical protein [Pseudomonadota bacterium]
MHALLKKQLSILPDRAHIRIYGSDSERFLENILTAKIASLKCKEDMLYSLLLSPQGKLLFDFFIIRDDVDNFILEICDRYLNEIRLKLCQYKMRSDVEIVIEENFKTIICMSAGSVDHKEVLYLDPRSKELGSRAIIHNDMYSVNQDIIDQYHATRISNNIAECGIDFGIGEFFPFALGMEKIGAISYNKGCYIGQEIISRFKHKNSQYKSGIYQIKFNNVNNNIGALKDEVIMHDGNKIGIMLGTYMNLGLALLDHHKVQLIIEGGFSHRVEIGQCLANLIIE